jgi:hypothetical protein
MNKSLDSATIAALLERGSDGDDSFIRKTYAIPEQYGPLRYFDPPWKPCASRGCRSPTPYKVSGIRYCTVHALRKLNDMLIERGVEK